MFLCLEHSQNALSFSQCCRPNGLTETPATSAPSVQHLHLSQQQEAAAVPQSLMRFLACSEQAGLKTLKSFGPGTTGGKTGRSAESGLCSGHTADVIPESLHHGGGWSLLTQRSRSVDVRLRPVGRGPAAGGGQRPAAPRQTPRDAANPRSSGIPVTETRPMTAVFCGHNSADCVVH